MPTKDERRDRPQGDQRDREREDATIEDEQREIQRQHEETEQRRREGTVRHGHPPPKRGLEGDEPFHQGTTRRDHREGVISRGSFTHVEKGKGQHKPKREESG